MRLTFQYMPGPVTCTMSVTYPGGTTQGLPTQTAVPVPRGGHGMTWTWTIPQGIPPGPAAANFACTWLGETRSDDLGFTVLAASP